MINRVPSLESHSIDTERNIAKQFLFVALFLFYSLLRVCDKYPMCIFVSFSCLCSGIHPTRVIHAHVSNVAFSEMFGRARKSDETFASLNAFIADNSCSLSGPNFVE